MDVKFTKTTEDNRELYSQCCGSSKWVNKMAGYGPFGSKEELLEQSERIWKALSQEDWKEAFLHHPKIGDIDSLKEKYSHTKDIAEKEQSGVNEASDETLWELAKLNDDYEKKFGYIFIVCATGKSAGEMLSIIRSRIQNDPETEIRIAMEEQNKITKLRLEKLF